MVEHRISRNGYLKNKKQAVPKMERWNGAKLLIFNVLSVPKPFQKWNDGTGKTKNRSKNGTAVERLIY